MTLHHHSGVASRWLVYIFLAAAILAGCLKHDPHPLVFKRIAIDPATIEVETAYGGEHRYRSFTVDVPGARGHHEIGIICDDTTWRAIWEQRHLVQWWGGFTQPYQPVAYLGAKGLECDQVPNCRYLGELTHLPCPDGTEPYGWEKPHVTFHLPETAKAPFEIIVLHSRSQRSLPPLATPKGGHQPPPTP